jgi:hypothetical protein
MKIAPIIGERYFGGVSQQISDRARIDIAQIADNEPAFGRRGDRTALTLRGRKT